MNLTYTFQILPLTLPLCSALSSGYQQITTENTIWKLYLLFGCDIQSDYSKIFIPLSWSLSFFLLSSLTLLAIIAKCVCWPRCKTWYSIPGLPGSARAAHAAAMLPLATRPTAIVHAGWVGHVYYHLCAKESTCIARKRWCASEMFMGKSNLLLFFFLVMLKGIMFEAFKFIR